MESFYALLGERHWVFHDTLSLEAVETRVVSAGSADAAEAALIQWYREEGNLSLLLRQTRAVPEVRPRLPLLEKALEDYQAGRFYASTLVLLAMMDGLVNDLESPRRGMHAREGSDFDVWDSFIGHAQGLAAGQASFTKGFFKTSTEPVHDLYRNGIMHGTLLNFDNVIVATKAWNRLFGVVNWAQARATEEKRRPEPSKPLGALLREIGQQQKERALDQEALSDWAPGSWTDPANTNPTHPLYQACRDFCLAWQAKRYDRMADLTAQQFRPKRAIEAVSRAYRGYALHSFEVLRVEHEALAAGWATVQLHSNITTEVRLRWIAETPDGESWLPSRGEGQWRLVAWEAPATQLWQQGLTSRET
ncbi:hypothetical protein EV189_1668 [Motilibacter rhizosphaerae]|uniref:Uncharacterized protein n=1 Tax=Motilibacter rhizosphaerae TaxID=598652 RepID=A0A4Q7NSQ5_9ACTN|nr:hypothetical protein EV189_1668 [Motilibacter rhizosphaerae]